MRLERFTLQGFQSYQSSQTLDVAKDITVLAGRNDVGKSALLRALSLQVSGDFTGARDDLQMQYTWGIPVPAPDGSSDANHSPGAQALYTILPDGVKFPAGTYHIRATVSKTPTLSQFPRAQITLPRPLGFASIGQLSLENISVPEIPAEISLTSDNSLAWVQDNLARTAEGGAIAQYLKEAVVGALTTIRYVSPRRLSGREPVQHSPTLRADGSNLTSTLSTLMLGQRHTTFARLESFVRKAFPEIESIDPTLSPDQQSSVSIRYQYKPDDPIDLRYCGTGIEQILMIGVAILTAPAPSIFLIDEPHAYLHPSAERSLLLFLKQHPEHQYIVATHSGVFLNAIPMSGVRLISRSETGSRFAVNVDRASILAELGVRASDLWSSDELLWIEGRSDVECIRTLIENDPAHDFRSRSLDLLPMPDWIRAGASQSRIEAIIRFCKEVSEATNALHQVSCFLFDGDERREAVKASTETVTAGEVRFLPVRELENMFLVPEAIHAVLRRICNDAELVPPTVAQIAEDLERLTADVANPRVYRRATPSPDDRRASGSAILHEIFWDRASTQYDKVTHGPILTLEVLKHSAEKLDPIRAVLEDLHSRALKVSGSVDG